MEERHGSESYYVIGEGLLGEALGGRQLSAATTAAAAPPFRFSRLGPKGVGKQLGEPNRRKIAEAMTVVNVSPGAVPAGYTYLGQFIDHDLTFDKSGLMEGADISPADLVQSRSPSLDLDSLYGAGPQDAGSAKFYAADGLHLKMGAAVGGGPNATTGFDLPREGASGTPGKAIIPDKRNDENLAVAQTHLAMIRFHNRVVDTLPASVPAAQRFTEARKIVTKHYQWMIRNDYLPRICAPAVVTNVFNQGRKAFEVGASPTAVPTMPIEFSVAAFRLGHSMVAGTYSWNKHFPNASLQDLFDFSQLSGGVSGGIPSIWIADFRRLYNFGQLSPAPPALVVPTGIFNRAMKLDTRLVNPLRNLPVTDPNPRKNLAFRNLLRANMVKLATGQQMATFLKSKGVTLTKLTNAQIRNGNGGASLAALDTTQRNALLANTPLWFYTLREAELNGGKLGGVGARIVAETFHRAMQGSKFSIVRDPAFRPTLGPNNTTFRMVDLLFFAFEGKAALLNPNGN
ncbi:MAG TPA: heme peroxidase family protein [Gaiellaceae bacterium]|nr:heme peroxidase family protein [Gaiellaceae bacterium]